MKFAVATALVALTVCGAAWAQTAATVPTSDAGKTFSFDRPAKWPPLDDMTRSGGSVKEYVSGTADEECYFNVIPRPETDGISPANVIKAWTAPLDKAKWGEALKGHILLGATPATVVTSGVDTSKTFPVQTATLKGEKNTVIAAITARPGVEIWSLCTAYDGKDHTAQFTTVAGSVSTPKDVEYKATLDAAAAAAAAPPPPAEKPKGR